MFRLDAPMLVMNAKLVRDRVRELLAAATEPVRIVLADAGPDVRAALDA